MQKNSITNKITPCCGLPFSVMYWWIMNLTLNSENDREFILSKISQGGTISIEAWKVLINSGTLETDAVLTKAEFLQLFDCGRQPKCNELKIIIESFKVGNYNPADEIPPNMIQFIEQTVKDNIGMISGGWTAQIEEPTVTLSNGDNVVVRKVVGYVGGTGDLPTELEANIGKYYDKNGGFTTDINEASSISLGLAKYVKKIDLKTLIGIERGVNLADLSKVQDGYYYSYASGSKIANSSYSALGLIEIEPNTEYQVPNTYTDQTAFFDENENYISGIAQVNPTTQKFTTPSNAKYVGLSLKPYNVSNFILAKSSEYPSAYVPYEEKLPKIRFEVEQINDFYKKIKNELGFETINLIDKTKIVYDKYYHYQNGSLASASGYVALGKYPVEPNTEYQISDFQTDQIAFYNKSDVFVGGIAQVNPTTHKFTTPSNAFFIGISAKPNQVDALILAKSINFPNYYIPFGTSIKNLIIEEESFSEIFVSANLNDSDVVFKGKNAIQEAIDTIDDATEKKRYRIVAKQGLYKITEANEYIGNVGYPAMVCPKDFVDIVGQGEDKTIIWAELPYNDANIGASIDGNNYARDRYQTIYNFAGNVTIKDLTFVAKNLRYVNHQDDGRGANKKRFYENVSFIFMGNKGYLKPFGIGTFSGEETHVSGGKSVSDSGDPCAIHNNVSFKKPSRWSFKNHTFMSMGSTTAIEMQNDGSLLQDTIELIGCNFAGMSYKINYVDVWLRGDLAPKYDSFNHAEWQISGFGNSPFLFENLVFGYCLRIQSNSTGINSNVRFDKTSSAYLVLIENTQGNSDKSLYFQNREFVDGYIVQDGTVGLKGQAFGCKDISETAYAYNAGNNYTSLGKRLGDCSTNNKVLRVTIDGVLKTITFNKNYTSFTNTQILNEINTAISGAGVADAYIYGRDYFPEITDVLERVYNLSGSAFIPKGTVLTKSSGKVRPANDGDVISGVALENIPVLSIDAEGVLKGQGRMMKKGLISANPSKAFFVLADNQNPSIGTKFKVVNGQLVTDVNGKISVNVDAGIISINC